MSTSVTSVVSHFPSPQNGFTTTLASTIASGATTVPLNSVAGYTNGQIAVFVVDPTSATLKQTFTGVIDTAGVQVTSVVYTAGTNASHSAGATVVDYATATHIAMMTKGIRVNHTQKGNHATLTDDSANEWIEQGSTASAVNQIKITNAAAATAPSITANGDDTNIDGLLIPKGTGSFRHAGPYDGWVAANETWTYASATTFTTASAAMAGRLAVGDKIKLTQTTPKYFYVTGISSTTITVNGGSDYSLANAAITLPFYSHETSPEAFPQWFAYVGAMKANGGTAPTYTATDVGKFRIVGRSCRTQFYKNNTAGGTAGAGAVSLQYTLPVSADTTTTAVNTVSCGIGNLINGAGTGLFTVRVNSATDVVCVPTSGSAYQNADQSNTTRQLFADFEYQI